MLRYFTPLMLCCAMPFLAIADENLPNLFDGGFNVGPAGAMDGVKISAKLVPVSQTSVDVEVTVLVPPNHYIYSTNPSFGAATTIKLKAPAGFENVGAIRADHPPKKVKDQYLGDVEKFFGKVTWTQRIRSAAGTLQPGLQISGELSGQYCSAGEDGRCNIIRKEKFAASLPVDFNAATLPAETVSSTGGSEAALTSSPGNTQTVVPKMRMPGGGQEAPIRYEVSLTPKDAQIGDEVKLAVKATISPSYHTFSVTQTGLGGEPTTIDLSDIRGLEPVGQTTFQPSTPPEIERPLPDMVLETHHDTVTWTRRFTLTHAAASVKGSIKFQVCDAKNCQPGPKTDFAVNIGDPTVTPTANLAMEASDGVDNNPAGADSVLTLAGLGPFIISAFGAGFLALLTPCVFPMIPITVSYFLKQGEERPGSTLKLAIIYCLGIIGAFTILGLLVAVIVGPGALQALANGPWLNLAFAGIFILFALMLMGMFEIQIPSWVLNWSSRKQDSGGIVGVLFMAVTFTLVSFTCTFAFVGSLLALAADGTFMKPIVGMLAFSTAFASPFFVLAMFPAMLQKLPKSGGWMNSVKVTLGLLELVIVAKFLSVADVGFSPNGMPRFLDFSLVIGMWIAITAVTGAYLLGLYRMPHDTPGNSVGAIRCLFAIGFLGISAYMSIGLVGARAPSGVIWQQIAAFAPQRFDKPAGGGGGGHEGLDFSLDFDEAVVSASEANRPLFVDITGINCHNCRVMEQTVLSQQSIQTILEELELVQLYTDSVPIDKSPEERERLLERNLKLQDELVGHTGIPTYAVVSPDGKKILSLVSGQKSADEFAKFLKAGISKWKSAGDATSAMERTATADPRGAGTSGIRLGGLGYGSGQSNDAVTQTSFQP
ncbi:protein-disulfide reductase DsbD family protein [Fuerstiella marisgermanici]|uniref:Thiol:disulfide interchange protein DsbD n=1 Tax=Fuerstiella marisgermanici TaxID=1891926 RepID=A0A1P8WC92_9PLAN|nr:cytochrome c biogenesis protein CcdA [Fuerstiella marisgermanici]APZ91664.1 Thiol:disulfide interchange protein DsbD precursor [Fuerstiella marisgermanici]